MNNLPLSRNDNSANHTIIRKEPEAGLYQVERSRKTIESDASNEKTWGPHVHALQELVPPKPLVNMNLTSSQALTSNSGLITRRTSKIGCSKVNNTLLTKTSEPKKVNSRGTENRIITV